MQSIGLLPNNNQSTVNGMQNFPIYVEDGSYTSQNVIYTKKGNNSSKKVVIATHYDSNYSVSIDDNGKYVYLGGEGASESGVGVATLLVLAEVLMGYDFDFDIEFVFFGAHNLSLAGSKFYTSFISKSDAENILLMINLDNIANDGKVCLYNGEFKNKTDDFVFNSFTKTFNACNLSDYNILADTNSESVTGLSYTNFALESDNAYFIKNNITTLSPMSLSDDSFGPLGIVLQRNVIPVNEDTFDNLKIRTNGKYKENASLIINCCENLLNTENFVSVMSNKDSSDSYVLFGNVKLFVFISVIVFILLVFIYSLIRSKMQRQAQQTKEVLNLDKVISTVNPNDYDNVEDLMNKLTEEFEKNIIEYENKTQKVQDSKKVKGNKTEEKELDKDKK